MPPPLDPTTMQTDLNLIHGPWKCRPPQRKLENGDPQARKKMRVTAAQGKQPSAKVSQHAAIGDVQKDAPGPHHHAACAGQNCDAESSDDAPSTSPSSRMCNAARPGCVQADDGMEGMPEDRVV
ncbi:hypothetical protein EI94DRAFT_1706274 [Lactarius quietus]|nr:hypothetical protein EI94DRAFT_1706274 [Lactarius quietus]